MLVNKTKDTFSSTKSHDKYLLKSIPISDNGGQVYNDFTSSLLSGSSRTLKPKIIPKLSGNVEVRSSNWPSISTDKTSQKRTLGGTGQLLSLSSSRITSFEGTHSSSSPYIRNWPSSDRNFSSIAPAVTPSYATTPPASVVSSVTLLSSQAVPSIYEQGSGAGIVKTYPSNGHSMSLSESNSYWQSDGQLPHTSMYQITLTVKGSVITRLLTTILHPSSNTSSCSPVFRCSTPTVLDDHIKSTHSNLSKGDKVAIGLAIPFGIMCFVVILLSFWWILSRKYWKRASTHRSLAINQNPLDNETKISENDIPFYKYNHSPSEAHTMF